MIYPDDWAIIPIKLNSKIPAVSGWQEKRIDKSKIMHHDGNLGLATGMISGGIVVFDWDFRRSFNRKQEGFETIYKEYCEALPFIAETLICETPNGFHFYYRYSDGEVGNTRNENAGYTANNKGFVSKCKTNFQKYLAGIDTRANGGYVIVPPSVVSGKRYSWINDNEIVDINKQEYEQIFNFFKPKKDTSIRKGFVDILLGNINPNEIKTEENKEHVYWKEVFHECMTVGGLRPEDLYKGLDKFQTGFDLEKTKIQVKNSKNDTYITNGKRLSKKKYEQYFPELVGIKEPEQTNMMEILRSAPETPILSEGIELEGRGVIVETEEGLFLERVRGKQIETVRILDGKFKISKVSFESNNYNRMLLTGVHKNSNFRTLPLSDLMVRLNDYTYRGTEGRDCVKRFVHQKVDQVDKYKLSYVLGFNSHWNLPHLEENEQVQIITSTDMQMNTYRKAQKYPKVYSEAEKKKIRALMSKFVKQTQLDRVKTGVIVGWAMASPFRHAFINQLSLFPILCAHGNRNTGKSAVLEFYCVDFFGIHNSYIGAGVLGSPSQFEDFLSSSSFPIFIEEVIYIPDNVLAIMKEHTTGTTQFRRKKSARELDFECIKSAGIAIDCNHLIKSLTDPAMNTKVLLLPFTEQEIIERDPEWVNIKNKLKKYNLFSMMYDYTKDWTEKTIIQKISGYYNEALLMLGIKRKDIEKNNPRLITQYMIISFGLELFNEIFGISFERKPIIDLLLGSRTIMTRSLLNDFHSFCTQAIYFDPDARGNPKYLNHELKEYNSRKYGKGFFFEATNKADFDNFTKEKHSFSELIEQLRDALTDKHKDYIRDHNTGKKRGIYIHQKFFEDNIIGG